MMFEKLVRIYRGMELEEKVLHTGVTISLIGLFIPWLGGQWSGITQQWNGFGFYTGFIGHGLLLCQLFIIAMTMSPLFGGPVFVRKASRHFVRFVLSAMNTILLLACFSILLRLTSEVSGAEIRFGIYIAIIGSVLTTLYAFLKFDEQRKNEVHQLFHHPDEQQVPKKVVELLFEDGLPPPPPPPPPLAAENHSHFKS